MKMFEDLRKWFDKDHPEGGWKRVNSKGEVVGPCAREPGEPKPKCMSNEKRAKLSKKQRAAAVSAKRRHDPVADRSGKGGAPVNVSNFGKGKLGEDMEYLDEKSRPTSPEKWARAVSMARSKFDVYPSAYANGWAAKKYKEMGGSWTTTNEEVEPPKKTFREIREACWTGYKQVGQKKKGDKMVPNCVPEENEIDEAQFEVGHAHNKTTRMTYSNIEAKNAKDAIARSQNKPDHELVHVYNNDTGTFHHPKTGRKMQDQFNEASPAWARKEGKSPSGGLNAKGIASYRRANPGSKLSMAVTTPPSKLDPKGKAAGRRRSFCARMGGSRGPMKDEKGQPTRKALALRKWNC